MSLSSCITWSAAEDADISTGAMRKKQANSGERCMKAVVYEKYGPPDVLQLKEVGEARARITEC